MLGMAFAGCSRRGPTLDFDGALVEDGQAEGHRLRDGWAVADPGPPVEVPILIVGGGVAGLSAAWSLLRSGLSSFRLLELGRNFGGTAVGGQGPGGPCPFGAHYLPAPLPHNQDLLALLEELGAVRPRPGGQLHFAEEHLVADPKERVWYRGTWFPGLYPRAAYSRADEAELVRFEARIDALVAQRGVDGRRPFSLPMALGSEDPEFLALDQLDLGAWLTREGFNGKLVREQAAYACRDDFGTEPEVTSAWYGLHYFAARIDRPGEESAELLSWPNGNFHLVQHLAKVIGDRAEAGLVTTQVAPSPDGRRALVTAVERHTGRARRYLADRVILAVPGHVRRRLLSGAWAAPDPTPDYAPWLVANLHLSKRPGYEGSELAWDNVIHGSKSLGYVVNNHRDGPSHGPTTFTYYLPLTGDPRTERQKLSSLTWRDAADLVLADLERCHRDLRRNLLRLDVWRWGHGMVRPTPGTLTSVARRDAARPVGPIHFAHTELSGVALFEEAFFHGLRAAAEVRLSLGSPR
jgi:phytoene dehydrogenase-like protein